MSGLQGLGLVIRKIIYTETKNNSINRNKNDLCYYLFIVLLILIVGRLLAWCVFKSDGSLSVKRTGPGSFELTAPMPRLELFIHGLRRDTVGAMVWRLILGGGGGQPGIWR